MKTPREILLARHQSLTPKLDAVRRAVVAELNGQAEKERRAPFDLAGWLVDCGNRIWLELFVPCRRTWAGLAAVWVLIVAVHLSIREHSPANAGRGPAKADMTALRDQRRLLDELLAGRALPVDVEPPRTFSPKPRAEKIGTAQA